MAAAPISARIATLFPGNSHAVIDGQTVLSKAKLTPPRMPAYVAAAHRYRQWLEPILAHDATVVCGPLGYGKTVFVAELYREAIESGIAAGWVSCAGAHGERLPFYIARAIDTAVGGRVPDPADVPSPAGLAVTLANSVLDFGEPVLLCLDDTDQIAGTEARAFLDEFADHCPTNLHIVMTCRDEGAVPIAFAPQHGAYQRLDVQVLRARDAEMAEFFGSLGVVISDRRARALNEVLGGWWSALHRAAIELRGSDWATGHDDWQRLCVQWVAPLFKGTLENMPERHRSVLSSCAVAPIVSTELAMLLSGEEVAGAMLREAASSGQFVDAIPGFADQFAVHPALRATLLAELGGTGSATVRGRSAQAIEWHVQHDQPGHAIAIASAGGSMEVCADLLIRFGMRAIELSGPCGVQEAIHRLPRAMICGSRELEHLACWASTLSGGDHSIATPASDSDLSLRSVRHRIRSAAAPSNAATLATTVDFQSRLEVAIEAASVARSGDHRHAQNLVRPIVRHGRSAGVGYAEAIALVTLADVHRAQGRPADAERLLRDGLADLAPGAGRKSGTAALLAVALADLCYLRDDLAAATSLIDDFLPVATRLGFAEPSLRAFRVAIRIAAAAGRSAEALSLIESAEEIGVDHDWPILVALGAVERLRLNIPLVANLDDVLLQDQEEAAIAAPASARARIFVLLSEARASEAIGNLDRPRLTQVASRMLELAEKRQDMELRVAGTLLNILPQLSGRCDRMVEIDTVKFLNHAARTGFVRTILDLLEITGVRTSQDFNRSEYAAGSFLALLRLSRPAQSEPMEAHNTAAPAFSFLTAREMEIVNALNDGETNKVIARKLGVTPETVKWHMKSLMRKLRATSREEVVSNAHLLGVSFTH
jgi:LuxR family transcriptional regulator, maltose regulon positive regulatory protein